MENLKSTVDESIMVPELTIINQLLYLRIGLEIPYDDPFGHCDVDQVLSGIFVLEEFELLFWDFRNRKSVVRLVFDILIKLGQWNLL